LNTPLKRGRVALKQPFAIGRVRVGFLPD